MGRESSLHERACQVLSRAIQGFQVLPCSVLCCFTAMQSEGLLPFCCSPRLRSDSESTGCILTPNIQLIEVINLLLITFLVSAILAVQDKREACKFTESTIYDDIESHNEKYTNR